MAISSCYNRNSALLFDNAHKDSLRYQSDQLVRCDLSSEGTSGSKDICEAISEYNTSSAGNFTRVHPTDHHTGPSSSSGNIMNGSDTHKMDTLAGTRLKNKSDEKDKDSPRVAAGNSWKNLVVKSRAMSTTNTELAAPVSQLGTELAASVPKLETELVAPISKLGDLVDIVRQSQYWGAQKKPYLGG